MLLSGCGVETELADRVLTVRLRGEIDHHNAGKMRMEIDEAICRNRPLRLVIELGEIDFMDSSGLGLMMGRYSLMKKFGGDVILKNPSERVRRVFDLAGLGRVMRIESEKEGKKS